MGRKRRHSPEPFLVFFGPITRKEIEVRRKLGLFENPDKEINMDDLDSDFWEYYYADENDENFNLTGGVRKSPKMSKFVGSTLHLSLLNEKDNRKNEISSSKKVRVSKSSMLSDGGENPPMPGILTESISNRTPNSEKSLCFEKNTYYPISKKVEDRNGKSMVTEVLNGPSQRSKTSVRSTRSSKVDAHNVNDNHLPGTSSEVNHAKSADVESNDDPQIPSTPENMVNRSLTSIQSSSNSPSSSKATSVLSSIKKKSKIPVSSKCRDKILRNIRNAGIVKTPRAGTPEVQKMSSIPHSATKLLSKAVKNSIQNTPQGIKTPSARQSSFSANKNNTSKLWQRKSVKTPVTKGTPMMDHNSAAKSNKAPFLKRSPTMGQDTPLSAIKKIYKTPLMKKLRPSDTPVSTIKTLYRTPKPQTLETPDTPLSTIKTLYTTPKPQTLETPDTPLSAIKKMYKTPKFKPTDVFNVGSNKNAQANPILPTPASTSRISIVASKLRKKDAISQITSATSEAKSPMIKSGSAIKDLGVNDSQKSKVGTPKTDSWEVDVVASTSKMHAENSQSLNPTGSGIKSRKNSHATPVASARFSSKTPRSIKRLTPKLRSVGRPPRRTPSNKKSSTDSYVTPDSFEVSKNYSFTPDLPKVKTNYLKAPKLLVNGREINDVNWTNKLNLNKVVQPKRPNYIYSPTSLKPI